MLRSILFLPLALTALFHQNVGDLPTIYLIGDSTMADKPITDNPERGWGQLLPAFFTDEVRIENHARNGRSTGSFIREGRWDTVTARLHAGDHVIIQFGHNDQSKQKGDRYTPPDVFTQNLRHFVLETRAKGASPVLCTPVMRRRFDSTGTFYDTHGIYPELTRAVARDMHVPLLDLHEKTRQLIVGHGEEGSKRIFLWILPGAFPSLPDGLTDNTHFSEYGATLVAKLAAEALREIGHPLATRLSVRTVTPETN